jgi:subtilisin family serine protease
MTPWISPKEAEAAMRNGTGQGVKVAIIDSGVENGHVGLAGLHLVDDIAIVPQENSIQICPGGARDIYGHGTAIAGIIHSLAPDAELGSFRVLGPKLRSRTQVICEGVRQALDRGYQILSCSLGCEGSSKFLLGYKVWIDEAYLEGAHVVSACAHEGLAKREWPSHFSSVISVDMARTDRGDVLFYRPGSLVEFAARGEDVDLLWNNGNRVKASGSSYAAPVASAILARLISIYPGLSPLAAKELLRLTAEPWSQSVAPRREPSRSQTLPRTR